jgi:CheY-like chemotaxis protein
MDKRLILYAEDDADDRFIFEDAFLKHKHEVDIRLFYNGLELINYLSAENQVHPSLIVLDINMPKLDGRETLRMLRDLPAYSDTPVAMLTTSSLLKDAEFARKYNAAFFTKSISIAEMQNITQQLLAHCRVEVLKPDHSSVAV